jgi:hypothetical protein
MAHSAGDLMAVLTNLGPDVRRGDSCACPGAALRLVALEFLLGHRPYTSSSVWLTGDRELYNGRRGGVPSARFPWCWGWPCSARDGGTSAGKTAQGRR